MAVLLWIVGGIIVLVQSMNFAGAIGLLAAIELAVLSKNEPLARALLERAKQFAAR